MMISRFQSFTSGITTCYKYIRRIKSAQMTEFGLRGTHVMCLFYLHQHPQGLAAAQLAELCVEDKAAISRTIAELEEKGYLYCGDGKKYRMPLFLTESGEQLARRMDQVIAQWVCAGGEGLEEAERESFYASLEKIAANLGKKMRTGKATE